MGYVVDPSNPGWLRDENADAALESSWWQIPAGFVADPANPGWFYRDGSDVSQQSNWVHDPSVAVLIAAEPEIQQRPGTVAGKFSTTPRGVILHGSRSGAGTNTVDQEYAGTANFAAGGANGLGWNLTCGDGKIALHIPPDAWGWNARAASSKYLAVEFAQAIEAHDITDGQVSAFAWWFLNIARKQWPDLPLVFPTHAEVERSGETGQIDGKSDVFGFGSPRAEELRARIRVALAPF